MLKNLRIYLPVVLVVAAAFSLVGMLDLRRAEQSLSTALVENQISIAREVSALLNASITKSKETAHIFANMPLVLSLLASPDAPDAESKAHLRDLIEFTTRQRDDIDSIVIFSRDGEVFLASRDIRFNAAHREYFTNALQGQTVLDSRISQSSGQRILFTIMPIKQGDTVVGALYVGFSAASLDSVLQSVLHRNKGYTVRIIAHDGVILCTSLGTDKAEKNIYDLPAGSILAAPQETPVYFAQDGERMGMWFPIADSPWKILVGLDTRQSFASLSALQHESLLTNAAAALLVLCAVAWMLHSMILRVRRAEEQGRAELLKAKMALEDTVLQRTEALNAQNAVLDMQRKTFASMLESSPIGVSVSSAEGKILFRNKQLDATLQCEGLNDPCPSYVNPEDRKDISAALRRGEIIRNRPTRMRDAQGRELYILVSAFPLEYEGNYAELRWLFDVTDQYEARMELAQERALLRAMFDAIPDLVFYKNRAGQYVTCNVAFAAFLGLDVASIIGKTDSEIFPNDENQARTFQAADRQVAEHGASIMLQESGRTADGREFQVETIKAPCVDKDGNLLGVLGISRDVAERNAYEKQLLLAQEQAQAASRAKSDFIANMSHEIRTPMNGIMGMARLALLSPQLTPQLQDYISKIDISARSLLRIINDILDFSKIEAGKLEMERIPFSLMSVLENSVQPVIPVVTSKDVDILIDIAPDIPDALLGDPTRLGQVLLNLINNAVKFTQEGHIMLRVERARDAGPQTVLRFSVADTGIGMEPQYLSRLFESFSQADTSITRRYGGTGLGLAICKQLVALMNGNISVESAPGKGSTFSFTAAFDLADTAPAPQSAETLPEGLRVLVADDNEISRRILCAYLDSLGVRADAAADGAEAVRRFEERKDSDEAYFAVLMDWKMPGLNGVEAAARIRGLPSPKSVPIIMVTAYERELVRQEAREAGVDDVLTKPVTPAALHDALLRAVKGGATATRGAETPGLTSAGGAETPQAQPLAGKRALLAEDNDINQIIAVEMLSALGLEVTVANNGAEAVELAFSQPFDVIFMDIQMPVMDGIAAAKRLRENAALKEVPIIAMTAHAMSGDAEKSHTAGMQAHVTKPIDPHDLYRTLLYWVAGGAEADMRR